MQLANISFTWFRLGYYNFDYRVGDLHLVLKLTTLTIHIKLSMFHPEYIALPSYIFLENTVVKVR